MDLQSSQKLEPWLQHIDILLNEFNLERTSLDQGQLDNLYVNRMDREIKNMFTYLNTLFNVLRRKVNQSTQHIFYTASITKPAIPNHTQFGIGHNRQSVIRIPNIQKRKFICRDKQRGPYRSYTRGEKNHVVSLHNNGMSFATISKKLRIPQKNIVRWCKQGILETDSNKRLADSHMEKVLWSWIQNHPLRQSLSYSGIQRKALKLSLNPHFKASRGWLKNFLKRYEHLNEKIATVESNIQEMIN